MCNLHIISGITRGPSRDWESLPSGNQNPFISSVASVPGLSQGLWAEEGAFENDRATFRQKAEVRIKPALHSRTLTARDNVYQKTLKGSTQRNKKCYQKSNIEQNEQRPKD